MNRAFGCNFVQPFALCVAQITVKGQCFANFMDEGIIMDEVVREFIALEMLDGITIKTARSSGIWQSQKIIRLAKEHGIALLGSGLTDPDISLVASLHLFAWAGIDKPCALNGPQFLGNTLIEHGLEQQGDIIRVPQSPGLGIVIQPDAEKHLVLVREM